MYRCSLGPRRRRALRPLGPELRLAFVLLPLLFVAACANGQIGGEVKEPIDTAEIGAACEVFATEPLQPAEDTELGFALGAVLAQLEEAPHEAVLLWGDGELASFDLLPAAGVSVLTVTVSYQAGSARLAQLQPLEAASDSAPAQPSCTALVLFEADVRVDAENGAFADTFSATFLARSADLVTTTIQLDLAQLVGSFSVSPRSDVDGAIAEVTLSLAFAGGEMSGAVDARLESGSGGASSSTPLSIAHFPE